MRMSKRVALFAGAIVGVLIVLPVSIWFGLTHEPDFYRSKVAIPVERRRQDAKKFVAQLHDEEPAADAAPYVPKFFDAHEWRTVLVLSDIIIPKDERSGSATDAKAPEFIDFMLMDKETSENSKVSMRGGLAWLDLEMIGRFGHTSLGQGIHRLGDPPTQASLNGRARKLIYTQF